MASDGLEHVASRFIRTLNKLYGTLIRIVSKRRKNKRYYVSMMIKFERDLCKNEKDNKKSINNINI